MIIIIAIILFLIFLLLSSIHFYWGFGGRWGSEAVFPTKDDSVPTKNPGSIPTFIVAFGLLGFGFLYLVKGGILSITLPFWIDKYGLWIIVTVFILRAIGEFNYVGFFKRYGQTKFGRNDTKYYSPLCLLIGLLTLVIELSN